MGKEAKMVGKEEKNEELRQMYGGPTITEYITVQIGIVLACTTYDRHHSRFTRKVLNAEIGIERKRGLTRNSWMDAVREKKVDNWKELVKNKE